MIESIYNLGIRKNSAGVYKTIVYSPLIRTIVVYYSSVTPSVRRTLAMHTSYKSAQRGVSRRRHKVPNWRDDWLFVSGALLLIVALHHFKKREECCFGHKNPSLYRWWWSIWWEWCSINTAQILNFLFFGRKNKGFTIMVTFPAIIFFFLWKYDL